MSDTGDARWRTARGSSQNQNRPPGQQQEQAPPRDRSSSSQTPGRRSGQGQGLSVMSGNAWAGERMNRDGASSGPTQEQHIPVRSFNAKETREELLRGYSSAMAGAEMTSHDTDLKPAVYKALGKEVNNAKPGGPWGSKPNTMANGKDFFLELRKQVSMIQSNPGMGST